MAVKSGVWDPYLYENYLGLSYLIEMLNPDSHISFVSFQKNDYETIDDVVVHYSDQREKCFQVKHQIKGSGSGNLTFGSLIGGANDKPLLACFYQGWSKAIALHPDIYFETILFTNKKSGKNQEKREFEKTTYKARGINAFFEKLETIIKDKRDYSSLAFPDSDFKMQWEEMLSVLPKDVPENVLAFLSCFRIESGEKDLKETQDALLNKLELAFHCDSLKAKSLFDHLFSRSRLWYSQGRASDQVTTEDVCDALSVSDDFDESQHQLFPPKPFFKSREDFATRVKDTLVNTDKKVVFLSGAPGSGKTSLLSFLDSRYQGLFFLRYFTYKPITPENHFLNEDQGVSTERSFWGTLLAELRIRFSGRLYQFNVPLANDFCTTEQLRSESLRLLAIQGGNAVKEQRKIIVCVDGVDHAARASCSPSFLDNLPSPSAIPDGVLFLIGGQPYSMYSKQYPFWLNNPAKVEPLSMPGLNEEDIRDLLIAKCPLLVSPTPSLPRRIFSKTNGNTLSVVYLVSALSKSLTEEEAIGIVEASTISDDLSVYYKMLWSSCEKAMASSFPSVHKLGNIVASSIVLFHGMVDTEVLSKGLASYQITSGQWSSVFSSLFPLMSPVEGQTNKFLILHNDFRLFLTNIADTDKAIYQECALMLARFLLEERKDVLAYALGFDLLHKAGRDSLIPSYFTPNYVIAACASGIPDAVLDDEAKTAFALACKSKNKKDLLSVYLAIKTLFQHHNYEDYYELKYPEDNLFFRENEVFLPKKHLKFAKDSLDAYEDVLFSTLKRFYQADKDAKREAELYYTAYFQMLTPLSCLPFATSQKAEGKADEDVLHFLRLWGTTLAKTGFSLPKVSVSQAPLEIDLLFSFSNAYLDTAFEAGDYSRCLDILGSGYASVDGFGQKMARIFYSPELDRFFSSLLFKFIQRTDKMDDRFFALACCARLGQWDFIDKTPIDGEKIVDSRSYERPLHLVLRSFCVGAKGRSQDDAVICSHAQEYAEQYLDSRDVDEMVSLNRLSCLIGKYTYSQTSPSSEMLNDIRRFLVNPYPRFFEFAESIRLLLSIIVSFQEKTKAFADDEFNTLLEKALRVLGGRASAFKTQILDYFQRRCEIDIIRHYIEDIFGPHGSLLFQEEDPISLFRTFEKYCKYSNPDFYYELATKIRWKVVGYTDHKEIALEGPYYTYCALADRDPRVWNGVGKELFGLSLTASHINNEYFEEIQRRLSEDSGRCGFSSFWEYHLWDENLQINRFALLQGIPGLIETVSTIQDLSVLWILASGLSSWHDPSEAASLLDLSDLFVERGKKLGVDFSCKIRGLTPEWESLLTRTRHLKEESENNLYSSSPERASLKPNFSTMGVDEIIATLENEKNSIDRFSLFKETFASLKERHLLDFQAYQKLLPSLCRLFEEYGWVEEGSLPLIEEYCKCVGDDAFWAFASSLSENLPQYNFQYSQRNLGALIRTDPNADDDFRQTICRQEINAQRQWITGSDHLGDFAVSVPAKTALPSPSNLGELSLYLLLEQIGTQGGQRTESAMPAIWELIVLDPSIVESICRVIPSLSSYQRYMVFLILFRWVREDRPFSEKIVAVIETEYRGTHLLTEKYLLHSLLLVSAKKDSYQKISYEQPSLGFVMPPKGADFPETRNVFLLVTETEAKDNDDVRRFILAQGETKLPNLFRNSNDLYESVISDKTNQCLYDFEKSGRWNETPLLKKEETLLAGDDPYLLTALPRFLPDNTEWKKAEDGIVKNGSFGPQERMSCHSAVLAGCPSSWLVLGADLYLPIRQNAAFEYCENTIIKDLLNPPTFSKPTSDFGNFSLFLGRESENDKNAKEKSGWLFYTLVGPFFFYTCAVSLIPSFMWENHLGCHPSPQSPLEWINDNGTVVLRFERIAFPGRDTIQQAYCRQPVLRRWICDKKWFSEVCAKKALTFDHNVKVIQLADLD